MNAKSDEPGFEITTVIVGTAGHIDHGKSTLVRRLTGIDPDRLPDEKKTGMTIDLGFAPMKLGNGRTIGLIDVPGHERFIRNMVAGATSLDVGMLVVDANEGVMPQTREHVEIMELLGVERGMIALTKIDTAGELAELAAEEVREALSGSFLADAPMFPVSAQTGEGMDKLIAGIHKAVKQTKTRRGRGPFRMPIQRVFSAKGFGTIVTGVPISGRADVGDTVEIVPLGQAGRVRGIQAYRHSADTARAGHSAALNVTDLDYKDVHRGMVVAEPGAFRAANMLECSFIHLESSARPLRHLEEIRFHTGTAEVLGQLAVLEGKDIAPGTETKVQVRLREPVVAVPGDRFILRRHAEQRTVGGGVVLGVSAHRLKSDKTFVLEALGRKEGALSDPKQLVAEALRLAGTDPQPADRLKVQTGLAAADVRDRLKELAEEGVVIPLRRGTLHAHREGVSLARKQVQQTIEALYEADPLRVHVTRLELRGKVRIQEDLLRYAIEALVAARRLEAHGDQLKKMGRTVELTAEQERVREAMIEAFTKAPFAPPTSKELAEELSPPGGLKEINKLLGILVSEGFLTHIGAGVHFMRSSVETGKETLLAPFREGKEFSAS
ncbi:MAG: selenocysteine-specific translation elongation factor, partial [Planctomycetota bacterium]